MASISFAVMMRVSFVFHAVDQNVLAGRDQIHREKLHSPRERTV